ncbi:helix-turn-helix transcriptional regulator [Exilibacterium tricleocarpae]|uniref:Helix-turn-helix transcriptional regulator n=1 Tax=Exilibacterium tricleocarpae TaxID=2591008 RepID=A0A545T0R0_9GAMM|nr:helix-turn-helix transcriptional regulator [Exilibacterium tricleocarpae]TQV70802.1 helix-turn-helix transcriptional regulator [Exilibacterium tricleocarpae]
MKPPEHATELKAELKRSLMAGELSLGEAIRRMRKIVGMNQTDYANKVANVAPRILMDIERGRGNPTVETLNKIGRPFGYKVGFVPKKPATDK